MGKFGHRLNTRRMPYKEGKSQGDVSISQDTPKIASKPPEASEERHGTDSP